MNDYSKDRGFLKDREEQDNLLLFYCLRDRDVRYQETEDEFTAFYESHFIKPTDKFINNPKFDNRNFYISFNVCIAWLDMILNALENMDIECALELINDLDCPIPVVQFIQIAPKELKDHVQQYDLNKDESDILLGNLMLLKFFLALFRRLRKDKVGASKVFTTFYKASMDFIFSFLDGNNEFSKREKNALKPILLDAFLNSPLRMNTFIQFGLEYRALEVMIDVLNLQTTCENLKCMDSTLIAKYMGGFNKAFIDIFLTVSDVYYPGLKEIFQEIFPDSK